MESESETFKTSCVLLLDYIMYGGLRQSEIEEQEDREESRDEEMPAMYA